MGIPAVNRRYLNKFNFYVRGGPFKRDTGFTTCSELKESVGVVESRQGGSLYAIKGPGLATVEQVTLTRPMTAQFYDLLSWFRRVADGSRITRRDTRGGTTGLGAPIESAYKYDIEVVQTDRSQFEVQAWRLVRAFISEITPVDGLDNNAEERVMESIVIVPERIEPVASAGTKVNVSVSSPLGDFGLSSDGDFDLAPNLNRLIA